MQAAIRYDVGMQLSSMHLGGNVVGYERDADGAHGRTQMLNQYCTRRSRALANLQPQASWPRTRLAGQPGGEAASRLI
jgi:hypothetical protein